MTPDACLAVVVVALAASACEPHVGERATRGDMQAPERSARPARTSAPHEAGRADRGAPAASPRDAAPRRLVVASPLVPIPVEGFGDAIVSLPIGAEGRRPVVLATHGNYDRPEWQCEVWRGIVSDRGFVLCPRGVPRPDSPAPDDIRFTYTSNLALEREIEAGLAALRTRYPEHVDDGPIVYTGFSLGAIMGVSILTRNAAKYPRAVLVEGGHDKWTRATVTAYAGSNEPRVLFACGQTSCEAAARRAAALLDKVHVATKIVSAKGLGHRYDDKVADAVRAAFDWVIEGDPRWAPELRGQP